MKKKIIIIAITVLVVGGITYKLVANKKIINQSNKTENTEVVIPVNTITTKFSEASRNLVKSGTLIPFKEADITAVNPGKLTSLNFELGDYVSRGTTLATVDNSALRLQLGAAQLAETQAKKDFDRFKVLFEGEATTKQDFQNAKLKYENTQNQIEQIQKQISDNGIKAPVSGQVVSKIKENGEYVSPGMVLGHIVEVNRLKVDVMVSEQDVYTLKNNASVSVTTDVYPGVTFDGKIIFISQKGDEVHNYKVEVALNNKTNHHLRGGSFAHVNFNRESNEKVMLVPKTALIESLEKPMVYVVDSGKAKIRNITVGNSFNNDIAVIDGLKPGEKVVTSGLINVSDGTPVKIISNKQVKEGSEKN